MGGKDHCCVINCTSGRRKARNNAEQLSFFSFPMGNGNMAKHRRVLWLGAGRMFVREPSWKYSAKLIGS